MVRTGRAKTCPASVVQDREPVLGVGKDLRPEVRGERLGEREERLFVPTLRVQVLGKDQRSTK